jgi:membrane protein implicated in regulation of membrane protease activity
MDREEGLGLKFWLWVAGIALAVGVGLLIFFLLIGWAWQAWGAFGALIFFSVILLAYGWIYDRRQDRKYKDLTAE